MWKPLKTPCGKSQQLELDRYSRISGGSRVVTHTALWFPGCHPCYPTEIYRKALELLYPKLHCRPPKPKIQHVLHLEPCLKNGMLILHDIHVLYSVLLVYNHCTSIYTHTSSVVDAHACQSHDSIDLLINIHSLSLATYMASQYFVTLPLFTHHYIQMLITNAS